MFRRLLGFLFRPRTLEYVDNNGNIVSESDILELMNDRVIESERRLEAYFRAYIRQDNDFEADDFRIQASAELRNAHFQLAMLAAGGRNFITEQQIRSIVDLLIVQFNYLEALVSRVEAEEVRDNEVLRRLAMYANSSREAFWLVETASRTRSGFTQERRVTTPAENCEDCISLEARGWQPIGTLPNPADGSTVCLTKCQCLKQYR